MPMPIPHFIEIACGVLDVKDTDRRTQALLYSFRATEYIRLQVQRV